MANYKYSGFTKDGRPVNGVKEAVSRQAALSLLTKEGYLISEIAEHLPSKNRFSFLRPKKNLADMFFQLSLLIRSGIPLVNALSILAGNTKKANEANTINDVMGKVSEGSKFSEALSRHVDYFSPMYVNLIKASENVGRLAEVLMDIAEYEESKKKNTDKLLSALTYPLTVLMLGLAVVAILLAVIVPKMQGIFASIQQELPPSTKMLLFVADFSKKYGIFIFLFIVLVAVFLKYMHSNNKTFRMWLDKKLFSINLVAESSLTRFLHVLAFQLKEGLPLTDALFYANQTVSNVYLKKVLGDVRESVQSGIKFSDSLKRTQVFPELFPAAVATGESSGNMPELLERVDHFYAKKIDKYISNIMNMMEPVFIVTLGLLVGFIVISIMQPLFNMNAMFTGG